MVLLRCASLLESRTWRRLAEEISDCRRCPRLVQWREQVARERRAAFARGALLGPAAARASAIRPRACSCSGWRRPRTGPTAPGACSPATARGTSCSPRCGAPASPTSRAPSSRDDGLRLTDVWVGAAVRCAPPANRPTPAERDAVPALERARAAAAARRARDPLPGRLRLGRGAAAERRARRAAGARCRDRGRASATAPSSRAERYTLLGCYHPSQQNTFTGKLTEPMIDAVLARARELTESAPSER